MNQCIYYQKVHQTYKDTFTLNNLIKRIQDGKQSIFIKYGDGEVECMKVSDSVEIGSYGQNCDNDVYFPELSNELKEAFYYFVENAIQDNIHIGKWHYQGESDYLSKLYYEKKDKSINKLIPFTNYHLVMNDKGGLSNLNMYQFVKCIKESDKYIKIVVSNPMNTLLKDLFCANYFIETPEKCLYLKINEIMENIYKIVDNYINKDNKNKKILLLTSCGLSAKVLIYRLCKKYGVHISAIDLGSSFDLLCKKRVTRSYQIEYSYDDIYQYYHTLM